VNGHGSIRFGFCAFDDAAAPGKDGVCQEIHLSKAGFMELLELMQSFAGVLN
jgi:hypothetical protein